MGVTGALEHCSLRVEFCTLSVAWYCYLSAGTGCSPQRPQGQWKWSHPLGATHTSGALCP